MRTNTAGKHSRRKGCPEAESFNSSAPPMPSPLPCPLPVHRPRHSFGRGAPGSGGRDVGLCAADRLPAGRKEGRAGRCRPMPGRTATASTYSLEDAEWASVNKGCREVSAWNRLWSSSVGVRPLAWECSSPVSECCSGGGTSPPSGRSKPISRRAAETPRREIGRPTGGLQ